MTLTSGASVKERAGIQCILPKRGQRTKTMASPTSSLLLTTLLFALLLWVSVSFSVTQVSAVSLHAGGGAAMIRQDSGHDLVAYTVRS